ncbi:MAG: histidine kinase [Lachnospiraceae bacterium]|nr:histidine kinase [Robinsoniella sp.]MDY3766070.1 histidine kinase [Lachnospiraceae bacterium]
MRTATKTATSYHSIKAHFIVSYLLTFLFSLCIALLGSRHFESELLKQTASTVESTLNLHLNTIDAKLEHVSTFLFSFLFDDSSYSSLSEDLSLEERIDGELEVRSQLTNYLHTYSNADGLFFYIPKSDVFLITSQAHESIYDRQAIESYVKSTCLGDYHGAFPQVWEWFPFSAHDSSFLMQIVCYNNVYIGSYLASSNLSDPLQEFVETSHATLFLSSEQLVSPLTLFDPEGNIAHQTAHSESYLSVSSISDIGDFQLQMMISKKELLKNGTQFSYTLYLVIILSMLFLVVNFLSTWRQIISPLEILTAGMKKLQKGIFDVSLPVPSQRNEFSILTETFNTMSHEIEHLKMQVYENRLKRVHTKLEYLTLQIKPHFFLNSLNVIYSLAITKHFDLIMELSSCLMKYFRYLFQSSETLVPLKDELNHTANYLRIQEMRYGTNFSTEIDVEEGLDCARIPILSIHTFVENIVKHAYHDAHSILVQIQISRTVKDHDDYIDIAISDNGKGFASEQLLALNESIHQEENLPQNHIGISNVKQRLFYLYEDRFLLTFENREDGGAMVHLQIPFLPSE